MRTLALTFGQATQASSHYRIHQYLAPLREHGIALATCAADDFQDWGGLRENDAVIVQKKLLSLGKVRAVRRAAKVLVYDIDDAIWHAHGRRHSWWTRVRTHLRLRAIVRSADLTLAANEVIAEKLRPWARRLEVLPMSLDEKSWTPRTPDAGTAPLIGWSGHPVNLRYLEAIEPALATVLREFPNARLAVFSGERPRFRDLRHDFIPFEAGAEPRVIRGFDIGLLPLDEGAFAAGKSPIKGLQYMASGIPTVLPARGAAMSMFRDSATALFANHDAEWAAALGALLRDPQRRAEMGAAARRDFDARHTLTGNAGVLARLLKSLA